MTGSIQEFGTRVTGAAYQLRPGGYIILRNEAGHIAVIEEPGGLFLPGGGQDPDESPEDAAIREAFEECGLRIRLGERVGVADEFLYAREEATYFQKRCTFFNATVVSHEIDSRAEREVRWIAPVEAVRRLAHGSQRWAVEVFTGR